MFKIIVMTDQIDTPSLMLLQFHFVNLFILLYNFFKIVKLKLQAVFLNNYNLKVETFQRPLFMRCERPLFMMCERQMNVCSIVT